MNKKTIRKIIYCSIVGGCAIFSLMFFSISQYEKAKYKASEQVRLSSESKLNNLTQGTELYTYWASINEDFIKISSDNRNAYIGTAIPAYTLSILTLVSFGLVLKDAEKQKEKEDNEVAQL